MMLELERDVTERKSVLNSAMKEYEEQESFGGGYLKRWQVWAWRTWST